MCIVYFWIVVLQIVTLHFAGNVSYSIELMKKRSTVLQKYLDHKADLELHALYALQALVHDLKHPHG